MDGITIPIPLLFVMIFLSVAGIVWLIVLWLERAADHNREKELQEFHRDAVSADIKYIARYVRDNMELMDKIKVTVSHLQNTMEHHNHKQDRENAAMSLTMRGFRSDIEDIKKNILSSEKRIIETIASTPVDKQATGDPETERAPERS